MLFITRGVVLSGKTTFVDKHFPNKNAIFSADDFRERYFGSKSKQALNDLVFSTINDMLDIRLAHKPAWTVYEATTIRIRDCSGVIEKCKKHKTPYTFISIEPPSLEELIDRNTKRYDRTGVFMPLHVIEKQLSNYHRCLPAFEDEAKNSTLCSLIQIDQNYEVIDAIN